MILMMVARLKWVHLTPSTLSLVSLPIQISFKNCKLFDLEGFLDVFSKNSDWY